MACEAERQRGGTPHPFDEPRVELTSYGPLHLNGGILVGKVRVDVGVRSNARPTLANTRTSDHTSVLGTVMLNNGLCCVVAGIYRPFVRVASWFGGLYSVLCRRNVDVSTDPTY